MPFPDDLDLEELRSENYGRAQDVPETTAANIPPLRDVASPAPLQPQFQGGQSPQPQAVEAQKPEYASSGVIGPTDAGANAGIMQRQMQQDNIRAMQQIAESGRDILKEADPNKRAAQLAAYGNFVERAFPEGSMTTFLPQDDAMKKHLVDEREKAKTLISNSNDVSPIQKKAMISRIDEQIKGIDPGGVYQRGGLLSRMTAAEKWMVQNVKQVPEMGGVFYNNGKEWKFEKIDTHEEQQQRIKLAEQKIVADNAAKEAAAQTKKIADEAKRNADHQKAVQKRISDYANEFAKLDAAARKVSTKPEPMVPWNEHIAKAREMVQEEEDAILEAEMSRLLPEGAYESGFYKGAYKSMFGHKPPAHTDEEYYNRHNKTMELLKKAPVRPAASNLTGTEEKLKKLEEAQRKKIPPMSPQDFYPSL